MHQEIAPTCNQQPSQTGHGACDIGITAGVGCDGGDTRWLRTSTGRSLTTGEPTMKDPRYGNKPPDNADEFRMRLTRVDIDRILHYTHPIPNMRGLTQKFLDENYPGGRLQTFMAVFKEAKILLRGGSVGGRCHWKLKHLYYSSRTNFFVEWDDDVTEDDNLFYGGYQFLRPLSDFLEPTEE